MRPSVPNRRERPVGFLATLNDRERPKVARRGFLRRTGALIFSLGMLLTGRPSLLVAQDDCCGPCIDGAFNALSECSNNCTEPGWQACINNCEEMFDNLMDSCCECSDSYLCEGNCF